MSVGRNLYARQKKQIKNIELIVFLFVNCFGKKPDTTLGHAFRVQKYIYIPDLYLNIFLNHRSFNHTKPNACEGFSPYYSI